jgi:hypothetical protein
MFHTEKNKITCGGAKALSQSNLKALELLDLGIS